MPDASSAHVRQELLPLLVAASDGVTAVAAANTTNDEPGVRTALTALVPVRDRLDQFVQDNQ